MRITFSPKDNGTCSILRCYQPAYWLRKLGLAETFVLDGRTSLSDGPEIIERSDILVMQYPHIPLHRGIVDRATIEGHPLIIVEMDDNPYDVGPSNRIGYKWFGTDEVDMKLPDGTLQPVWVNGVCDFDAVRNKERIDTWTHCLSTARCATTTTERLADVFRQHNPNVFAWPNCLDFSIWTGARLPKKDSLIRIGWHGGVSHWEDIVLVADALEQILKDNPDVRLSVFGEPYEGPLENLNPDQIERTDWTDAMCFPYVMQTLGIDIGICPLEKNPFNVAKSPLKWIEYSSFGIPVVASKVPPYSDTIEDERDGFLATNSTANWVDALQCLIDNIERRKEIGGAAQERVREEFDIKKRIGELHAFYLNVLGKD